MRIVFFGTSEIGVPILEALHKNHEVVLVVSTPAKPTGRKQIITPSSISNTANQLNLPIITPQKVKTNTELWDDLKKYNADIFIVVSYGKILPLDLINIPPLKTVNVHFSLLPAYRGPAPVQFALLEGKTKTGTTIFVLDELVDHGPVIAMAEIQIDPDDTNITLQSKLAQLSAELLIETLPKYESGEITLQEQNHELATGSKIITKEDGKIDWSQGVQSIYNKFRAFQPWPGIYTSFEGKIFKILNCKPAQATHLSPGKIERNMVGCGNNTAIELITVQLEGKNPVSIQDFLNGHPKFADSLLN